MVLRSLIFWLKKLEKNQNGEITHWQIKVVFEGFLSEIPKMEDEEMKMLILPIFPTLLDTASHNHKALVAKFMLALILDHEESKKRKKSSEDDSIF